VAGFDNETGLFVYKLFLRFLPVAACASFGDGLITVLTAEVSQPTGTSFMSRTPRQEVLDSNVLSVIMGGGQGTRLFPLTKERAKPAVPLAGKYRLVDIPISNCINSGLRRIYLLTQFNTASLHRHISQSYKFDHFSRGFVEVLAAQQTTRPGMKAPRMPCAKTWSTSSITTSSTC
jgi:hypothetical protein